MPQTSPQCIPRGWALHQHCSTMSTAGNIHLGACSPLDLCQNQTGLVYPSWNGICTPPTQRHCFQTDLLPQPPQSLWDNHSSRNWGQVLSVGTASTARAALLNKGGYQRDPSTRPEQSKEQEWDEDLCFEPMMRPHQQAPVSGHTQEQQAACRGRRLSSSMGKDNSLSLPRLRDAQSQCDSSPSPHHAGSGAFLGAPSEGQAWNPCTWLAAGALQRVAAALGSSSRASPSSAEVSGAAGPRGWKGQQGWARRLGRPPTQRCRDASSFIYKGTKEYLIFFNQCKIGPDGAERSDGRRLLRPWPGCFVHGGRRSPGASAPGY